MAGKRHQTAEFPGFPGGVNNVFREDSVPANQLRSAVNVDLLPDGKVRRRSGYLRRLSLTDARSAASHFGQIYLADVDQLKRINPNDFSETSLAEIPRDAHLSFATLNEFLYIAAEGAGYRIAPDGSIAEWSPEQPAGQPDVSAQTLGALPAGDYQIAIVYMRSGEESGTVLSVGATLSNQGSIQLANVPQPSHSDTDTIRVYMTHANGEVFYQARDLSVGTSSVTLTNLPEGKQLETQFMEPVPPGHIVRSYNGYLIAARNNVMYHSQALRYGLCNMAQDYIEFESRITMIMPVESGVYVATERRTHFLAGNRPEEFIRSNAHHEGAVEGSEALVPANVFPFDNLQTGEVAVWWSTGGSMILGLPNGQIQVIRDGELSLPEYSRGATMLREENGIRQLVSTLQQPKTAEGALAASDEAVVTVHRNGIEI